MEYAETATVKNGALMFGNYRLEPASAPARNQFGYEHEGWTWAAVQRAGVPIWAEPDGQVWCEDPNRGLPTGNRA